MAVEIHRAKKERPPVCCGRESFLKLIVEKRRGCVKVIGYCSGGSLRDFNVPDFRINEGGSSIRRSLNRLEICKILAQGLIICFLEIRQCKSGSG